MFEQAVQFVLSVIVYPIIMAVGSYFLFSELWYRHYRKKTIDKLTTEYLKQATNELSKTLLNSSSGVPKGTVSYSLSPRVEKIYVDPAFDSGIIEIKKDANLSSDKLGGVLRLSDGRKFLVQLHDVNYKN